MRGAWLVLVLLVSPALVSAAAAPRVLDAEAPWWETTMLDADRDGLDDALPPILAGSDPLVLLVAYAAPPTPDQLAALADHGATVTATYEHFPLVAARVAPGQARGLLDAPGVVFVEANDVLVPLLKDSVPLIGAPQAWQKYGVTGAGITVAVLDDGAFTNHPDFDGKVAASYDAAIPSNPFTPNSPVAIVAPASDEGHATHVAGTIAGSGDQSNGVYKGVAPDARFANVKVFSAPNQTSSDIVLRGLDWTLSNAGRLGIRVASLSLGGRISDGTDAISRAADIAVDKGMIVVAASGNQGPGAKTVTSPGAAEKAITVGAVDKRKALASFSSRGPTLDGRVKPDLVAPGKDITSTIPPHSTTGLRSLAGGQVFYGTLSGTSMATPHVSGVIALMLEANPDLTPLDVKRILLATAQDLGKPGLDNETGYGFVNAVASVQVATQPALLQSSQFASRLDTIPDPPEESLLERLTYEMQSAQRQGLLPLYASLGVAAFALVVIVGLLAKRRAR